MVDALGTSLTIIEKRLCHVLFFLVPCTPRGDAATLLDGRSLLATRTSSHQLLERTPSPPDPPLISSPTRPRSKDRLPASPAAPDFPQL